MTFSGDEFDELLLIGYTQALLNKKGLQLNPKKTRVMHSAWRQTITGLVAGRVLQDGIGVY
jgi:hypothetical protein